MKGLTTAAAEKRLLQYGKNELKPQSKKGKTLRLALSQFCDVLVVILLAAAGVSLVLGDVSEALTIGVILLLNATLGFFQEFHTERALEKLRDLAAPKATVYRDGKPTALPSSLLVPDDVVILSTGDKVPADGVLTEAFSLSFDESMLTGESVAVEKEKKDFVFSGCVVTSGHGEVRVTKTGGTTELGKIAGMIRDTKNEPTPLQKRLGSLGFFIGGACIFTCAAVSVIGMLQGHPPHTMLLTGVSLAVAAVPEGLPAIVTVALALAVGRMVKRRALIRKLHAVETLGCATVICSDKTGTLTQNRMSVQEVFATGDPTMLHLILAHCGNDTDPTERALSAYARDAKPSRRLHELPFDSTRKRMSVLAECDGHTYVLTKGAPDLLLPLCTHYETSTGVFPLTSEMRRHIAERNTAFAKKALRTLGFAWCERDTLREEGLVFCGLVGLMDPPRKDVKAAVHACRTAGITPVMITGDHAVTARAIGEMTGIYREGDTLLTGDAIDALTDPELIRALSRTSVFARVTPYHKLRIVRAYKARGEIVAMTGDGVNDAPAVKEADIGVAMGKSGTDVTREAASVVLLDDSFSTLIEAVEEGRGIYANIRKFIRYLLSCNLGEVCTMLFAMLFALPTPLIPIQILFVNLVTDGLPALALGLEPADRDVMRIPPRKKEEGVFSGGLLRLIVSRGLLIGFATLFVFSTLYRTCGLMPARTGALTTLIFAQLFHVFECKSETKSLLHVHIFNNPALLGAVALSALALLAAVYLPPIAHIFDLYPLTLRQLGFSFGIATLIPTLSGIVLRVETCYNRKKRKGGTILGKPNKR